MVTPELSLKSGPCYVCEKKSGLLESEFISIPLTLEELAARTLLFLPALIPALSSGPRDWTTNHTPYSLLMERPEAQSLGQTSVAVMSTVDILSKLSVGFTSCFVGKVIYYLSG